MPSRATDNAVEPDRADTILSRFLDRAARDPERVVFTVYPLGAINALSSVNWGDWATRSRAVGGALLALHLRKGDRVAIYAANRELWPVATLGAALVGVITVSLCPEATTAQLVAQLRDCEPAVVVVDTLARLKTLRAAQAELQLSFTIVCEDLEPLRSSTAESLFEWESWLKAGGAALQQYEPLRRELAARVAGVVPKDVLNIAYKSGTDVGVMYSHESMLATAVALAHSLPVTHTDRVAVAESFCRPFECAVGLYTTIVAGSTVALVEHPSEATAVARQFDATLVCGSGHLLREVLRAPRLAPEHHSDIHGPGLPLLGERCRLLLIGAEAATVPADVDLSTAGVAVAAVYGTAEQLCVCRNGPANWRRDSLGYPFPQLETRAGAVDELQLRRGAMTSAGYFRREPAFRERFTDDGIWLRTGDRVQQLPDGALRYAGPVSDVIMLSGGASTNSLTLEAELSALPHVAHAVCSGAHDRSLVAVLSLRRKEVEAWALARGVVAPWEALVGHPLVYDELARGVAEINASRDRRHRVVAFAPTELEFSASTGELDAAGQLNRTVVLSRFEHVFEDLRNSARR